MRGRGKFNVYELRNYFFTIWCAWHIHYIIYICKQCLRKLQKRRGLRTNLRELDEDNFQSYSSKACKAGLSIKKKAVQVHDLTTEESVSPEKRILLEESSVLNRQIIIRTFVARFILQRLWKTGVKLQCTTQIWSRYPWKFKSHSRTEKLTCMHVVIPIQAFRRKPAKETKIFI